jgi:hypothetical protein
MERQLGEKLVRMTCTSVLRGMSLVSRDLVRLADTVEVSIFQKRKKDPVI